MLYITFDKVAKDGFIVVEGGHVLKEEVQVQGHCLLIKKAEGPALKSFWDKHGNHYTGILKKQKQERAAKDKVITFMDKDYPDLERLKQVFRNIINSVAND